MHDEPTIPLDPEHAVDFAPVTPRDAKPQGNSKVKAPTSGEPEELQRHLPQYRVRELLGRGGAGSVIKVDDPKLARTVALKVMKLGPNATEEQRGRFVREATVLARLAHPNIVPIYDLGADEAGSPFYTMKLVKGRTLHAILKDLRDGVPDATKQHTLDRLLSVFRKICDAVAFAHSKDVLHRDLKPENIMVGEFGEVLVMDWGLAKLLHGEEEAWTGAAVSKSMIEQSRISIGPSALDVTLEGTLMGTPQYMSPEQAERRIADMDVRSDIFSLGAILYAILTLHPPVEGKTVAEVLRKISSGQIAVPSTFGAKSETHSAPCAKGEVLDARVFRPLPHCPGGRVPSALSAVTMKALSVDKARRYQSVSEFSSEVEAWQSGFATRAENASLGRQVVLLVQRHKGIFTTAFAAWLIITALAVWFVIGITMAKNHFEMERNRAERALANLKATAPDMLALAASEAAAQNFESALRKVDAALVLDPNLIAAYWRRGWVLFAQEKLPEAIVALHLAVNKDPANQHLAALLPLVEKMAAAPAEKRHDFEIIKPLYDYLTSVDAFGEATSLLPHLKLANDARLALVRERVKHWMGRVSSNYKEAPSVALLDVRLSVQLSGLRLGKLDPLKGLPIDELFVENCGISILEPLRGMRLTRLSAGYSAIDDLSPLVGMPLQQLTIHNSPIYDLTPLRGMPLKILECQGDHRLNDIRPLTQLPLTSLVIADCPVSDFSALRGMPLQMLQASGTRFADGGILAGMPLTQLFLNQTSFADTTTLVGLPLRVLKVESCPISDYAPLLRIPSLESLETSAPIERILPLRSHPGLKQIKYGNQTSRPVAEIWAEYDAHTVRPIEALREMGVKDATVNQLKLRSDGLLEIDLHGLPVSDLSPLAGLPVVALNVGGTKITDLSPLKGMSVKHLNIKNSPIGDLSPLHGMPLVDLNIGFLNPGESEEGKVRISDLTPLRGMPLVSLYLDGTNDLDLTPLAECQTLQRIVLPPKVRNVEVLRKLASLKQISWGYPGNWDKMPLPTAFWKEYDAKKEAAAK